MDLDWRVGKGFSLFSSLAGSLLVGDFDLSLKESDEFGGLTFPRAGLGYTYRLENGMFIGAKAGYEWQNWFNMVTMQRFVDDVDPQLMYTDTTDISLDGFFLEGFINF